ncbi:recombination directionality factor [Streptomyces zaehneri]|uniref:recombination directionality factor n=1 Tax=Streptomyces zaehneri TaxID=3051180 RepID=UPI0028D85972|nr:hypothetical protein [Streptomyces sp. DSM 40713]
MPDDFAGWFRFGRLVDNQPQALSSWRITTQDLSTANSIGQFFGGIPNRWRTNSPDHFEVLTGTPMVRITLNDPHCITPEMKKWGHKGLMHHCDGSQFLSPHQKKGSYCGCPESLCERKERARSYLGPQPSTEVSFKVSDAPSLGYFRMHSVSWRFAESASAIRDLIN